MRCSRRVLAGLALVGALTVVMGPAGVGALHEDQVGSFDWHKQYLGRVTQAAFAGTKGNKRVFVSSDQGAIAALSFKTGEIGACRAAPISPSSSRRTRASCHTHQNPPPHRFFYHTFCVDSNLGQK